MALIASTAKSISLGVLNGPIEESNSALRKVPKVLWAHGAQCRPAPGHNPVLAVQQKRAISALSWPVKSTETTRGARFIGSLSAGDPGAVEGG